jgi:DNA-binding NarL/FixJ family response regulator
MICRRRSGYHRADTTCRITPLEDRVLQLYAAGLNRAQIGERVGLSERTVGHYLTVVKEKLGATTLVQAAVLVLYDSIGLKSRS